MLYDHQKYSKVDVSDIRSKSKPTKYDLSVHKRSFFARTAVYALRHGPVSFESSRFAFMAPVGAASLLWRSQTATGSTPHWSVSKTSSTVNPRKAMGSDKKQSFESCL